MVAGDAVFICGIAGAWLAVRTSALGVGGAQSPVAHICCHLARYPLRNRVARLCDLPGPGHAPAARHAGATPERIRALSPMLHHYISQLHAAIAGLFVALGLTVGALGLFGVPAGQRWGPCGPRSLRPSSGWP